MKTAILGAGAMGSLVGAHLKMGGAEVYFIDVNEDHMKAVAKNGICMELENETEPRTVFVDGAEVNGDKVGICDAVIVLVKCYDTEAALEANRALFGKDTIAISLQNGVGGADLVAKHIKPDCVGLGLLKSSANLIAPGRILGNPRFSNSPKGVYFAPAKQDSPYRSLYKELEEYLNKGGMPAEVYDNIQEIIWDKLCSNAMMNGLAALLQLSVEEISNHSDSLYIINQIALEACQVASARGIDLIAGNYISENDKNGIDLSATETRHYVSMVLDAYHKRRTEIDFINGAIVMEGRKFGIPTPYNEAIWRIVRTLHDTYDNRYKPRI